MSAAGLANARVGGGAGAAAAAAGVLARRLPPTGLRPPSTTAAGARTLWQHGSGCLGRRSCRASAAPPPDGPTAIAEDRSAAEAEAAATAAEAAAAPASTAAALSAPSRQQAAASPSGQPAPPPPPPEGEDQGKGRAPGGTVFGLSAETFGKLCLLGVALLWGSYNPMLKLLYSQDGPPGPVVIMVFRGVVQAMVLAAAYSIAASNGRAGSSPAQAAAAAQREEAKEAGAAERAAGWGPLGWARRAAARIPFTAIAATELGTWLFLATGIQTVGLQLTTATRAGFLIQATALITPLLASFTGEKPSRNVWAGCVVALSGCLLIAADAAATDSDDAVFSLGGDVAILSAAFFFSLATVRLGTYARSIPSVELAAAKSFVLGGVALATFTAVAAAMAVDGEPLTELWPGYTNPLSWGVLIYSALGPGALAAFLHAKGQSVVPPAEAQVIFSTVPLWSVAFAFLLLGGEPLSQYTLVGGAAVVAAGLIASRKDEPKGGGGDGPSGGKAPGKSA